MAALAPEAVTAPELQTDDRLLRWFGLLLVLSLFGGLGGWAMLAPLSSAALAPGVVTVENYRKTVQHLEGGIIKTIQVRNGELVAKEQVLMTLDDTQPRAQLEVLRGQYYIALAREARLPAQRDGLESIRYATELLDEQDDSRVQDAIRVQTQTFKVRQSAHQGEINLYERQVEQLRAKTVGLREQKQSRDRLVSSYLSELEDFRSLLTKGYTERQKVRELERRLAESESDRGELLTDLAVTELQISETQLKVLQIKKEFQREVAKELGEVQADLFELHEKLQSLRATVARTVIKAPEAGMVLDLAVHPLGAVIPPGGKILDIVP